MVWPIIAAAAIGAAANMLSGQADREAQEDANLANYNAQKEFAQSGITWKVADATRAGLHPLYALGGGGAAYSPSFKMESAGEGIRGMGQDLSRAAAAMDPSARELQQAQLEAVRASAFKDYALGSAAAAEAAKSQQGGAASNPIATAHPVYLAGTSNSLIPIDAQGEPLYAPGTRSDTSLAPLPPAPPPYMVAGDAKPGFQEFNVPGVGRVLLPAASSMSEALESLEDTKLQAIVVAANAAHYGSAQGKRLASFLEGKVKGAGMWRLWSDPMGLGVEKLGKYLDQYRR